MMAVAEKLAAVREKIKEACEKSGRDASEITLVAVTKTVSPDLIRQAMDCGAVILGENRVQELCEKYPLLEGAKWHLIGHLQTNQVKQAVGKAELIHSVDSIRLAEEIDKAAKKEGIVQQILLEINISGEESK
ncbi:MAG: alanine racemase, partial [Clostridia bacterium]|nr:alanine racemase [Clostridia bacterium]